LNCPNAVEKYVEVLLGAAIELLCVRGDEHQKLRAAKLVAEGLDMSKTEADTLLTFPARQNRRWCKNG